MKILVINAGSSSLKYQLIDMTDESVLAKGNCERIGIEGGNIAHKLPDGTTIKESCNFPTHTEAFLAVIRMLTTGEHAVISDLKEISAIGHRIVQGGKYFSKSVLVTDEVIDRIESISDLAPLHNPAHVQAIRACQKVFGKEVPEVVVFDTAFHQTMPPKAYMFGVPYKYYEKYQVRKYGFHGTSHRYVSNVLLNSLVLTKTTPKLSSATLETVLPFVRLTAENVWIPAWALLRWMVWLWVPVPARLTLRLFCIS